MADSWQRITMSVKLDDYREQLDDINPALHAPLEANFAEARRLVRLAKQALPPAGQAPLARGRH